jgi:hypothetical protein
VEDLIDRRRFFGGAEKFFSGQSVKKAWGGPALS